MSKNVKQLREKYLRQQRRKNNIQFLIIFLAIACISVFFYFFIYKPDEKRFVRHSRYAYSLIQNELRNYYIDNNKKIYASAGDQVDLFCAHLANKLSIDGNCNVGVVVDVKPNLVLENGTEIYGFEKPLFVSMGTLAKDILIDVDGPKGDNEIGKDRLPLRIYSSGYLGGRLTPVNCNRLDEKTYGMQVSSYCPIGYEVNFLMQNTPLSFDAYQVDGDKKLKTVAKNTTFLRADCMGYGGELLGYIEYCDKMGYYWVKSCYYDYYCEIGLSSK